MNEQRIRGAKNPTGSNTIAVAKEIAKILSYNETKINDIDNIFYTAKQFLRVEIIDAISDGI